MFVMTIDQRGSRTGADLVPELLSTLRDVPALRPFERSVGDEIQGVLDDPRSVVEVSMRALRSGHWYVGIGIGAVEVPLPASPREGAGTAFVLARQAVERAKKAGERVPLSVQAAPDREGTPGGGPAPAAPAAKAAEAVLILVGDLVRRRSDAEWRVLDVLNEPETRRQIDVARALDISAQAVSKAILRAGWQEEQGGRKAAELLLGHANPWTDPCRMAGSTEATSGTPTFLDISRSLSVPADRLGSEQEDR